ncbi:tetratricopeptide repeat protein 23 isoform X4 [Balaenoptera acutorostrata]|uniref:Tetratricopeptide repeat protein 23 isoform X4 n=1 Tax=Balaenoptera acutorostrata TaxID=9767 RepID=A0A452CNG1_BALAC|nr:tetratricopeptide repeat protein 23 isoform X4 [Balaenoptera acutorostrata]
MQESQETHISNHLDEIVAAVSITPRKKLQNKLLQTALFQPPREKLHLCEEKAKSYSSSHEYKQALQELVRCVALTRICYGDSHWKLAEAHVNLAQGYLQLKGLSLQAKQHAEKAKEILTNAIAHLIVLSRNPSQEEAAVSAHSIACAAVASGRPEHHDVAEQYFQDSMANLKDAEGIGKAKFLSIQDDYCHFLQVTGQKERATSILRESLEAKVAVFGDLSPEVAETYRLLGGADLAQGNQSGAHKKLKKCLQIQTLLYGPQDKRTLATQRTMDVLSKAPEKAVKPRQPPRAKAAFCTCGPQHTVLGKARPNAAD